MRLSLTLPGLVAAALSAVLLAFGFLARSPTLVGLGAFAVLPLVADLLLGVAAPLRLHDGDLRLGWSVPGRRRRHPVGRPVPVDLVLRNPSSLPVEIDRAQLFSGPRLRTERSALLLPTLPARSEIRHRFRVIPLAPGRVVLHGLLVWLSTPLGFCRYRLYFPHPLTLRVVPPFLRRPTAPPRSGSTDMRGPVPRVRARAAGDDPDLREIREHRPGDPFRRIAWRPSARTGRLLTKEYERQLPHRHLVLLDASASTLRRVEGHAPLDALAAEAFASAMSALRSGDAVGLTLFDQRPVLRLPPRGGLAAAEPLLDGLLEAYHPVDHDAVDVTADDLTQIVGRYLLLHHGVETRMAGPRGGFYDRAGVVAAARRLGLGGEGSAREVRGEDADDTFLRRVCLDRGIELPPQERYDPHGRARGLREALAAGLEPGARLHQIHVHTDLDDAAAWASLAPELERLRRGRTRVRCVLPSLAPRAADPLHTLEARLRRRRHAALTRLLARHGVSVSLAAPPPARGTLGRTEPEAAGAPAARRPASAPG